MSRQSTPKCFFLCISRECGAKIFRSDINHFHHKFLFGIKKEFKKKLVDQEDMRRVVFQVFFLCIINKTGL